MKTLWSHSEFTQRAISDNRKGQLSRYLECIREELGYAFESELPQVDGKRDFCAPKPYFVNEVAER
jgi:hypothetical protein